MSTSKVLIRMLNGITVLAAVFGINGAWAADPANPPDQQSSAHLLPSPPKGSDSMLGKDYALRDFHAVDEQGKPADVKAALMDVATGAGDWDKPNAADVPPLERGLIDKAHGQLQFFYTSLGWIPVPLGWKVQSAGEGADGSASYVFVAPKGSQDGWIGTGGDGGCEGCMYSDADGLIPAAHKGMADIMGLEDASVPAVVKPTPNILNRPDNCTVLFSYTQPASPKIWGLVYLQMSDGVAQEEHSLYVALPDADAGFITLIDTYFQHHLPKCDS